LRGSLKQLDKAMFAVVRTGGKQYRVAAGDKIVVEKIAGEAGDKVQLGDVLLAGEGAELRSTDGLTVAAEIVAQAKADKVIIFKKKRRHNYRRKKGHRQQHTILRILSIGGEGAKAAPKKATKAKPAEEAEAQPAAPAKAAAPAAEAKKGRARKDESQAIAEAEAHPQAPLKVEGVESEMTDTPAPAKCTRKKKDAE
jgi:large subunit ribosomal protein L21